MCCSYLLLFIFTVVYIYCCLLLLQCPFSDTEPELRSLSVYQTMTTDSVITIDRVSFSPSLLSLLSPSLYLSVSPSPLFEGLAFYYY